MKKFLTLVILATAAICTSAKEYNGRLMVVVNGMATPAPATINIAQQDDGRYTLSLRNLILNMAGTELPVGNIVLGDIEAEHEGDGTVFNVEQGITIEDGDLEGVPMWLGPMIGEVPIKMNATLLGERLTVDIDIFLEMLGQSISVYFDNSATQIPNSDFELFHKESMKTGFIFTTTVTEDEPDHWHSFLSGTGSWITVAATKHTEISNDVRPGSEGSKSLLVKAGSVMGVVANGTITTGRINAGSTTADSKDNNAFADMGKTDRDANGDPFYTELQTLPDSLVVWVKFNQKKALAEHPYATVSAAITDGTYYQDPEDKEYTNVVARAANREIASTNQWQRISMPFVYTGNDVAPRCILVTLSTNADAGKGNDGDELYVDDLELIYNHRLSSLQLDGKSVAGFSPEQAEYKAEVPASFTEADVQATADGRAAIVSKAIVGEEGERTLLITVISADLKEATTYTVNLTTTTGIETIDHSPLTIDHSSAVYDLQGKKMADDYELCIMNYALPKGIYIVRDRNGQTRKVIIK